MYPLFLNLQENSTTSSWSRVVTPGAFFVVKMTSFVYMIYSLVSFFVAPQKFGLLPTDMYRPFVYALQLGSRRVIDLYLDRS